MRGGWVLCSFKACLVGLVGATLALTLAACSATTTGPVTGPPPGRDEALARGQSLFASGKFAKAIEAYEKAASLDPGSARAWEGLGVSHLRLDSLNPAEEALKKAQQLDRGKASIARDLLLIEARKAGARDGLRLLEEGEADFPGDAFLHKEAALMALKCDLLERARSHHDQVSNAAVRQELAGLDQALREEALRRAEEGRKLISDDPETARAIFEAALRLDPRSAVIWNEVGRAQLLQAAWPQALVSFERAVALAPEAVIFRENLGFAALKSGKRKRAAEVYREAIDQGSTAAVFYERLADLLVEDERPDAAIDVLTVGRMRLPENAALIIRLEAMYADQGWKYLREGNLVGAAELFSAGLELARSEDTQADFLLGNGCVLVRQGSLERAENTLREALALRPHHTQAREALGRLLENFGRAWDAKRVYEQGLELAEDDSPEAMVWTDHLVEVELRRLLADGDLEAARSFLEDERRNLGETAGLAFLAGLVNLATYQNARTMSDELSEAGKTALSRAELFLKVAVERAPDNARFAAAYAEVLAATGDSEAVQALWELQRASVLPLDIEVRLGRVLLESGSAESARSVLAGCLKMAPGRGEIVYALLRVGASLRDVEGSIELLRAGQPALTRAQLLELKSRPEFARLRLNQQFESLVLAALADRERGSGNPAILEGPFQPGSSTPVASGEDPFSNGSSERDPFAATTADPFQDDPPENTEPDPFAPDPFTEEQPDPFATPAPPAPVEAPPPEDPFASDDPEDPFAQPAPVDADTAGASSRRPRRNGAQGP